jgi:hypothetical protein
MLHKVKKKKEIAGRVSLATANPNHSRISPKKLAPETYSNIPPTKYSSSFKGIGSILLLKNVLKIFFAEKNYKNYLRSNNYEVYTAVANCFPNILDVMVLENIKMS